MLGGDGRRQVRLYGIRERRLEVFVCARFPMPRLR